jgi:hypothetical protein
MILLSIDLQSEEKMNQYQINLNNIKTSITTFEDVFCDYKVFLV